MKMNDSGNIFTQFFAWVGTFAAALGFTTRMLFTCSLVLSAYLYPLRHTLTGE